MRRALACVGVLLAGVLAPGAICAQPMAERFDSLGVVTQPVNPTWGPPTTDRGQCVQARTLSGVVASNDRDVIFRFGRAEFYRLRLTNPCPALLEPGAHVVDIKRGSTVIICDPRDMELKVAVGQGPVSRCTVDSLNRMSTAEVKAASARR